METGGVKIQRRWLIVLLLAIALLPAIVHALSISDLTAQVNRAVAGGLGEAEEQALIGQLGDASVEFANRYDQWVRSGSAESRAAADSLGSALLPLVERLHEYHQNRIEKAQNDIIAQDGNPEVLYEQRWWQVDRGFALATAGQLGWLYYRVAMLHPEAGEVNKTRLKKAVKNFSEFVYSEDRRLAEESLLGRALCEKEIGETQQAIGDLKAIIDRGKDSPLYWPARLTLAETKAAAGQDGLGETQRLAADARAAGLPQDVQNQIMLLRFTALAAASKAGAGPNVKTEAVNLSRQLSALGPSWSKKVTDIALRNLDDPRQLLGATASAEWIAAENLASDEKFKEAIPAYEAVAKSAAAGSEQASLVNHRLGVCYFRVGRWSDAERSFRNFLNASASSPLAGEAAYLRFRAAEGILRDTANPETQELFVSAVEDYVKNHPKHGNAYEGWFRLGEILQARRDFLAAADAFSKVKGAPVAFEIRATSSEVQSLADVLLSSPKDADKTWSAPLRDRAVKAFARFEQLVGKEKGAAIADLRARTTLAKAMAEGAGPGARAPDMLATLKDFETRFPAVKDVHPLAAALRLSANTVLGQLDEAERSMVTLIGWNDPRAVELIDKVAKIFLRNALDEAGRDQGASDRWMKLAATTYDRLKQAGRAVPAEARASLAQFCVDQNRLDEAARLYAEIVKDSPGSKTILRNAAMLADRRNAHAEAAEYWSRLAKLQEVATPAWYDARIQTAEKLMAAGQVRQSCDSVREVDGFRPDLRDAPTRKRFEDIAARACRNPKS